MKPVCVPCERFMRPKTNGFYCIEGMPADGVINPLPGKRQPEGWKPYKLWVGDKYYCPDCNAEIVVGFSQIAISEHFMPDFEQCVKRRGASFLIKDC